MLAVATACTAVRQLFFVQSSRPLFDAPPAVHAPPAPFLRSSSYEVVQSILNTAVDYMASVCGQKEEIVYIYILYSSPARTLTLP